MIWNLSILLTGLFFALALEPRWSKIPRWAYAIIFFLFIFPTARIKISDPLNPFYFWIIFFTTLAYVIVAFRDRLWKRILVFLLLAAGSEVSEIPSNYILDIMKESFDSTMNSAHMMIGVAIATLNLTIVLSLFLMVWNRVISGKGISRHGFIFFVFPISQVAMLFAFDNYSEHAPYINNVFLGSGALLGLISDFILLYVLLEQGKKASLELELRELETLHRLEEVHYQAIEARREELAKIRHDINNQLAAAYHLSKLGQNEKAEELLSELRDQIGRTREYLYCANAVVNAVLTEKAAECKKSGINLETAIELSEETSIQAVHLCSVFSNLCDNAINAAKECPQEQRRLSVHAVQKGDYLHVKVENSSLDPKSKARASRKAYGQEILKDIAARYQGALTYGWENGIYRAMVSLTVPESPE